MSGRIDGIGGRGKEEKRKRGDGGPLGGPGVHVPCKAARASREMRAWKAPGRMMARDNMVLRDG